MLKSTTLRKVRIGDSIVVSFGSLDKYEKVLICQHVIAPEIEKKMAGTLMNLQLALKEISGAVDLDGCPIVLEHEGDRVALTSVVTLMTRLPTDVKNTLTHVAFDLMMEWSPKEFKDAGGKILDAEIIQSEATH